MLTILFFPAFRDSKTLALDDDETETTKRVSSDDGINGVALTKIRHSENNSSAVAPGKGMVLPFQPHSLAFNHINYYVDMPAVRQCIFYILLSHIQQLI